MRGSPRDGSAHPPLSATRASPQADISPRHAQTRAGGESLGKTEASKAERVSRYAKPKVLMGEVAAPIAKFAASGGGQQIGRQRDAFRAFMIARHLRPSDWARAAGIAPGEVMAFLTGHARAIAPASLEKLARAAGCAVEDLFR